MNQETPQNNTCLVCKNRTDKATTEEEILHADRNNVYKHSCPICGEYRIRKNAFEKLLEIQDEKIEDFVSFVNYIKGKKFEGEKDLITIESEEQLHEIINSNPSPTNLVEKIGKILAQFFKQTKVVGQQFHLLPRERDCYYYWCITPDELISVIGLLLKENYIECADSTGINLNPQNRDFRKSQLYSIHLTHKGINAGLEAHLKSATSNKCFVAMSFDENLKQLMGDVFIPAADEADKIRAFRIDHKEHNDNIDDHIIVEIKESRFMIADLTDQKQGVYWEAGFAEGLGKKVIYTCRKDEVDEKKVHFDLNHRNIIVWENSNLDEFKQRLINRIKATVL